jgi:hypothetical protein
MIHEKRIQHILYVHGEFPDALYIICGVTVVRPFYNSSIYLKKNTALIRKINTCEMIKCTLSKFKR